MKKPKIAKADKPETEPKVRKVRGAKPPVSTVAGSNAMDPDKRALYKSYLEAYHAEQARQIKGGIKPLDASEMN